MLRPSTLTVIGAFFWLTVAGASEQPYVLEDRSPDVVGAEFSVSPSVAYSTACDYGLDPELGEVVVALRHDRSHGLFWEVGYTDWAKHEGISAYCIDASSGVVVDVFANVRSHSKKRTGFEIDEAEALVDSCPPATPVVRFAGAKRGYYPTGPCVIGADVMNARRGTIEAYVLELTDDRTAPEDMGLVLESLGGRHPLSANWAPQEPFYPRIKFHRDSLMLFIGWDDGNDEYQEPIQNDFAVYAIDRAGNRSSIPDTLVVDLPERLVQDR